MFIKISNKSVEANREKSNDKLHFVPEAYAGFWRGGEHLPTPPPSPRRNMYLYIIHMIWTIWWLLTGMMDISVVEPEPDFLAGAGEKALAPGCCCLA